MPDFTAVFICVSVVTAVQAAFLVMGHVGGKLLLFQSGLPTLGAGRLKASRDNPNLYNSEREPSLRNPEDPFFKRYAGEASSRQITLDVFLGTSSFADLASLASIPRYTCGQVRVVLVLSCVYA
jgi:protein transport protein SEC24